MKYEILALGSNGSGQLGLGHRDDVDAPCLSLAAQSTTSRPLKVVAGGNHTLLQYEDGTVLATGENDNGRCGIDAQSELLRAFTQVYVTGDISVRHDKFRLCSATWEASTFVTLDNKVYTCGTGTKGELGLGPEITAVKTATIIPDFPPLGIHITKLASCLSHTIAVLSNGEVYGWGYGRKGQLGEPAGTIWRPRRISGIDFKVAHAVCGRNFSCVLGNSVDGRCVVLGGDKWSTRSSAPSSVTGWKAVNATWSSIFVLGQDGELSGWGRNDHNQLPQSGFPLVDSFAAGSEHVVARTMSGEVIAWGWGEHGNCGSPVAEDGFVDGLYNRVCQDQKSQILGAGCATTWILRNV